MRLFFALWPPRETALALRAWAASVQRSSGGRVTDPEKIHLTMAFLGDIDERRASSLKDLNLKAKRHALPIERAVYWKRNRILWVGPAENPEELGELVQELHTKLRGNSFALENRPFAAHVTLMRKAGTPQSIPALPEISWPVNELTLIRSQPSSKGSTYEVLQRYPLS